ncbi:hypothetical protein [Bacillus bingmayongensis]|uniref:hypothetical protein n=1 Tax=Bacillus bingmayongensis TaxID=1150157 RepID=UPI0035ABFABA
MDIEEKKKIVIEKFNKQNILFLQATNAFTEINKLFTDFNKQYSQILREAFKPLQNIELQGIEKDWLEAAESLGKNGWTLPMLMDVRDHFELSHINDIKEIDNSIEHYHADENVYKELKSEVINHELTSEWKELLVQCFDNYEKENYLIVIPNLFMIFEGIAYNLIKPRYQKTIKANYSGTIKGPYNKVKEQIESDNTYIIYYSSIVEFINTTFRYGDFDNRTSRFDIINRNWVLHGRDNTCHWDKIDALRLFIALHTIIQLDFLLDEIEADEDEKELIK